ncbi:HAD family hydrolase [Niabella sp. 22666]|uniref:HAD family hydrolase n=1 Tax=Niabella sp. 22666 TaxID=3453954 RepID=UPI003F861DDB
MKIDILPYQHFSFDLWLTLIKSNPCYKHKKSVLFKEYFSISAPIANIEQTLRYYDILSNKTSEKTGIHINRDQIYYQVLSRFDISKDTIPYAHLCEFYRLCDDLLIEYKPELIDPDIHSLFNKIAARGKTINILSNTAFIHGSMLRNILAYYELSDFFAFQLYSDETGYTKPNRKAFELVFDRVNAIKKVERSKIVHIGDNETADIEGAAVAGFQSILIKN